MKKKLHDKQTVFKTKEINRSILKQYGVIIAIWAIIAFVLILLFAFYTYEMESIYAMNVTLSRAVTIDGKEHITETVARWRELLPHSNIGLDQQTIYEAMVKQVFGTSSDILRVGQQIPLIWFSCMLFIPNFSSVSNWQTCWDTKLLNVTTCQIYILISTLLAMIGLVFYLVLVSQYRYKLHVAEKKKLSNKYPLYKNDLSLYSNTTYVNFIIAISIFFTFYALSATLIMLVYMLIIKAIYKKIEKINANNNIYDNIFKTSDLSYFKTLFIVMGVMILYNIANSIITNQLNVDINSVLSGFFSVGGIAVIIVSLVKNLLSSSITQIKKKMNNIDKQIKEIYFFYSIRKGEAAFDFEFAKLLPPVIKKMINNDEAVDSKKIQQAFDKLFAYTEFVINYKFKKNRRANKKNKQFILYRMYNEIESFDEMEDIKLNWIKTQAI